MGPGPLRIAAFSLLTAACVPLPGGRAPVVPMLRLGPDRTRVPYDDPHLAVKRVLLGRINRDRAESGAGPLLYESRASLVGDLFCLDAALAGSVSHWDTRGRAPYLRWGLAGGVDYHSENTAAFSFSSGRIDRPLVDLLLEAHEDMMAERPPADGHRRAILDPTFTHVGIGVAAVGGQFRMSQEFTRSVFEWVEVPAGPLRAGEMAPFAGRAPAMWEVRVVEVRFEPPPRPLSLGDLKTRGSYGYPRVLHLLRPKLSGASFRTAFPLSAGPGNYFVLCYLLPLGGFSGPIQPATAALITAVP